MRERWAGRTGEWRGMGEVKRRKCKKDGTGKEWRSGESKDREKPISQP